MQRLRSFSVIKDQTTFHEVSRKLFWFKCKYGFTVWNL